MPSGQHDQEKAYTFSETAKPSLRTKIKKQRKKKLFLLALATYFICLPGKRARAEALPSKRQ